MIPFKRWESSGLVLYVAHGVMIDADITILDDNREIGYNVKHLSKGTLKIGMDTGNLVTKWWLWLDLQNSGIRQHYLVIFQMIHASFGEILNVCQHNKGFMGVPFAYVDNESINQLFLKLPLLMKLLHGA